MERIMQIFYGNDFLPYKDKERTVHYPIVGSSFNGMNNVNELRFYVGEIGGVNNLSWVAIAKLPNGKIIYQLLTDVRIDREINEYYVVFNVSQFYTQLKGDVYISLNGCKGQVEIETDEETNISQISGEIDDSTVITTGAIKLVINYAPQRPIGFSFDIDQYQEIINALANKSNVINTIQVVSTIPQDLSLYEDGQLLYCNGSYYEIVETSGVKNAVLADKNGLLGGKHALLRYEFTQSSTLGDIAEHSRFFLLNYGGKEYLAYSTTDGEFSDITYLDLETMSLYIYANYNSATFSDVFANAHRIDYVQKSSTPNIVYGTNQNGYDATLHYATNVIASYLVQRDANGQINVPNTPTQNSHATSKSYTDTTFGNKVELSVDENYDLKVVLKNANNQIISQADVDLPLESIIVSAQYYERYVYDGTVYVKVLVIQLSTTDEPVIIPIGDLIDGLVSQAAFEQTVLYLQSQINNKVAKQTNSGSYAYGHAGANEFQFEISVNASAGTIAYRDSAGNIKVSATPINGNDATSKTYVDTFGRTLDISIDNSTYVITFKLKDNSGNTISTQTIDLPLETMVVNGRYDDQTESLILELKNGQLITIPISDLISGLVTNTSLATTLTNYYTKAQIDQMVSGFVFADVDDTLSTTSENPVQNKVITNALAEKADTRDLLNGTIVPNKSLQAHSIEPVSEDSGSIQETPFSYQGTGTANGSASVDTSPVGKQLEKQGNTVVVNQQVVNGDFSNGTNGWAYNTNVISASVSNKVLTATMISNSVFQFYRQTKTISGHKYLIYLRVKTSANHNIIARMASDMSIKAYCQANQWTNIFGIHTSSTTGNSETNIYDTTEMFDANETVQATCFYAVDLTQWFGSNDNIPQDLLDHPSNFFRYYNGSLAYNEGTLATCDGQYLVCGGRNVWDEEWELGSLSYSTGGKTASSTDIRSKNYIKCIPNCAYYCNIANNIFFYDKDKNFIGYSYVYGQFTTPSNACYMMFTRDGTTYSNNITISLYYTTGDSYDQYFPYEQPKVYDTGNEILRSAGSVKDYKTPDGTITRRVGSYTFTGEETFAVQEAELCIYRFDMNAKGMATAIHSRVLSSIYAEDLSHGIDVNMNDNSIITYNGYLYVRDTSCATASALVAKLSGSKINFKLAEPTTEQGTSFSENIEINDYGTMGWLDDNNDYVEIPQGCKIFYPADYVLFIDSLGQREDVNWNPNAFVSQQQLANYLKTISGYDATKTQTLKNVNGSFTWVDD